MRPSFRVFKWVLILSRVLFGRGSVFIIGVLVREKMTILVQGALFDPGQGLGKGLLRGFDPYGLQGSGFGPGFQDPFDRLAVKGLVTVGVGHGGVEVLCMIVFPEEENIPGVEAAVTWVFTLKPFKKKLGRKAQGQKRFPDRLQSIPNFLVLAMFRKLDRPGRRRKANARGKRSV